MPRPEKMYMYVARVTDLGRNPWRFCPNSSDPHPEIPIPTAFHNQRLQGLIHMWHTCIVLFSIGSLTNNDPVSRWSSGKSQAYRPGGSFNKKMVKIIPTSQFHKKVRATRGLAPTSQLPWWCYIENEPTNWERNGLIETPTLQGFFAKQMRK